MTAKRDRRGLLFPVLLVPPGARVSKEVRVLLVRKVLLA